MSNIVITAVSGQTYFDVDFGVYGADKFIPNHRFFWAEDIIYVDDNDTTHHVVVEMKGLSSELWTLCYTECFGAMIVDSVLGVAPTDNAHLSTLIANLKG